MTLVEFLYPLKGGKQRDLVLATMYFLKRYKDRTQVTSPEVRTALAATKLPKTKAINVNDVINRSAVHVQSEGAKENGAMLFALTETGEKYVRDLLGLPSAEPEIEHDVAALTGLTNSIADSQAKGYVEEAITCLQFGALRAAVVFLWAGAVRTLQHAALARGTRTLNAAIKKQDPAARDIKTVTDFAWVKDRTFLDACPDLALLDKSQKTVLIGALDLRNMCGHPSSYTPGIKKVSAFVEDVIGIVFA